MKHLRGAKVIVLDDDESEAVPIIKALARQGIAVAFFDENIASLPSPNNRLIGVRLAILDMDLGVAGDNERAMASAVVKRVEKIIHPENGPYAALIWTNHPEVKEHFEKTVFESAAPNPVATIVVTKAEVKNHAGTNFRISEIVRRVRQELQTVGPLEALQAWESCSFQAAAKVTAALSDLTHPNANELPGWRAEWKRELLRLLRAMADATAEKSLDARSCMPTIYRSLIPLHSDRLGAEASHASLDIPNQVTEIIDATADPGTVRRARINSMMHLDFQRRSGLNAGNLYFFAGRKAPAWVPLPAAILQGFLQGAAPELLAAAVPVLVEISAKCDHAQRKIQLARLLAGVVIPANLRRQLNERAVNREGSALWHMGPVTLEAAGLANGEYYLQFSSRHVFSLTLRQVARMKASCKLRSQVFAHLQSWFAFQASRPGLVLLKDH